MLKFFKIFSIIIALALLLTGCGPSEEEIKSLGFSNAAEMKDIQAKGFKTKRDYETQIALDEAKAKAEKEAREEAERQAQAKAQAEKEALEEAERQAQAKAQAEKKAREAAERQAQAGKAIKVFRKREWVSGWNKSVTYLNIQSVTDAVTVKQVVLNRGRCQFYFVMTNRGATRLPIQLSFGDVVKFDLDSPPCDLLEVDVTTNLGTTSYSF